ncbi:MAG: hypothetical protein WAW96_01755 [Alphaproteobacteria bacterium]
MNSRILFRSSLTLSVLALLLPFAANAQMQGAPSAQSSATADAAALTCKIGSPETVITNNGSATLPAGTRIIVRYYPGPGAGGTMTQKVLHLKNALAAGSNMSFAGESYGFYQDCTARVSA